MGLKYRLETEIELKESAQGFYKMFKGQCLHVPRVSPAWIQDVKIHQGDWETHGSIRIWNYTAAGKAEVYKERVEFDDENTTVTLVGLDGDYSKHYKRDSYKATYKFTPKGSGSGSVANLSIVYEKVSDDVPPPEHYIDLMVGLTKDIEDHLCNCAQTNK